jgi:hypothetical protein
MSISVKPRKTLEGSCEDFPTDAAMFRQIPVGYEYHSTDFQKDTVMFPSDSGSWKMLENYCSGYGEIRTGILLPCSECISRRFHCFPAWIRPECTGINIASCSILADPVEGIIDLGNCADEHPIADRSTSPKRLMMKMMNTRSYCNNLQSNPKLNQTHRNEGLDLMHILLYSRSPQQ